MEQNELYKEVWNKEYIIDKTNRVGWSMNNYHFHDHFEIYLSLTNHIKVYVNGRFYQVNRGSLLLYNHMDLHKIVVPKGVPYERYIFHFKPEYINNFSLPDVDLLDCFLNRAPDFCHMIQLEEKQLSDFEILLDKAIEKYENPTFGGNLYNKILLAELLLNINPLYRSRIDIPFIESKDYLRIQPVLKYIHENLGSQLSVESIATAFYLSSPHLEYLFKKVTCTSINKYIIYRRILKAREYLKNGMNVSQVSESVGFNNISHFIRTFKKIVGVSPTQYVKNNIERTR